MLPILCCLLFAADDNLIFNVFNAERRLAGLPPVQVDARLMQVARQRLYQPQDRAHVGLREDVERAGWPVRSVQMRPHWSWNFSECGPVVCSSAISDQDIRILISRLRTTPIAQDPYHVGDFHTRWTHIGFARAGDRYTIIYGRAP